MHYIGRTFYRWEIKKSRKITFSRSQYSYIAHLKTEHMNPDPKIQNFLVTLMTIKVGFYQLFSF